ncbi:efflux RND transporter permease subunit [Bordetella sp. N]|uniref:efflux RND transporter permease subunit n=1 Tax=Bordetella sp. N TaxID=1746199 RepID=UPI00070C5047|nr:efflux RND transporter permease subunit [Bordetella sp. N]ALM82638.1 RND transporter [Bordetella sp. N]
MSAVQLALRRPYTFIVMALLIILATPFALMRMATDIFPEINIPVISVIWSYNGLSAQEMGLRIAASNERGLTTTVSDIEHIESTSLAGISVIKIFFQPNANIQTALAQVVAAEQTQVRQLPPGITPPLVIKYSASSIPVIQLALSSPTLPEQTLYDTAMNQLRPQLVTIPGVAVPAAYGGKTRVISVDLDLQALQARGLSSSDVVNAINAQNLILPSGTAKFGETEYSIKMNSSPVTLAGMNNLPIRSIPGGGTTYLRDVAYVRDGFTPQTNVVRQDGVRGVLLSVLKNGGASTVDIVNNLREMLPRAVQLLPSDVKVTPLFDQSVFVKAAVKGVVLEALIAAALTAAMVLLFLGNWRSTLIIGLTIPLSILASILVLQITGETLNLMTLGGLALSVGILVDQAIVTIENIERHLHLGTELRQAILTGAEEIGTAALVSTLCICIVFVPMFFLSGVARFLFVPLAEAVVYAMIASYILSRTLVPTLVMLLMAGHHDTSGSNSLLQRVYRAFDRRFELLRRAYTLALSAQLSRRKAFALAFSGFSLLSCALYPFLGRDFFPSVDAGQLRLHMRAPTGTRIEETARLADEVERHIRTLIPAEQLETILDNLGIPNSGINLSYSNAGTFSTLDGEILISLREGHDPTVKFEQLLRMDLPRQFPGVEFFFQPADIVTQILNFGLPAAINVQFTGQNYTANADLAAELVKAVRNIPGAVDAHVHQRLDLPTVNLEMDRSRLQQVGLSPANVGQNVLIALSGSSQTSPAFWLNPQNGVVYNVTTQTPQYNIDSLDRLLNLPVGATGAGAGTPGGSTQLLGNLVEATQTRQPAVMSRYNILPAIDVYISVQGTDLASVAKQVEREVDALRAKLPRGSQVAIRGQVQTMQSSFVGLGVGLAMAIVLVYLLVVVNFQSWIDALIIISALPAALAGIAWMLFITGTTLSVPALTGAIMTMGVATANSILMVSFARQRREEGATVLAAALEAGATRIRPVLMTALAMIIGMIPMALGLGEGAEQNAPLGRAVIGGLLFATVSTLFFVPVVYAGVHSRLAQRNAARAARRGPPRGDPPHGNTPPYTPDPARQET